MGRNALKVHFLSVASIFPGQTLPSYLRRLKLQCQARLGLVSQAIVDADELVRSHETVNNLITLMNLQLEQVDLPGFARTATRLLNHSDIHPAVLLRTARCVLSEDLNLARRLWKRAVTEQINAEILGEVITLGYTLGLDQDVQPFVHQGQILASSGEGSFYTVEIDELLELQQKWVENAQDMAFRYEKAELPIHWLTKANRLSLTDFFRVRFTANAIEPDPHLQLPVFIRYGARPFPQSISDSETQWRLNLDISAFLLAAHLGILDMIERRFSPLRISQALSTALMQECEFFIQHQPSRLTNYREILRLHRAKQLHELPPSLLPSSKFLIEQLGEQTAVLLEQAQSEHGFAVEFQPLQRLNSDQVIQPVVLDENDRQHIIGCRTLVEVLKDDGVLSISAYEAALNHLGDQRYAVSCQSPKRNDSLFVNSELANLLAGSDLFAKICRHFRVFVTSHCIFEAQAVLDASEKAIEVVRWIRELMQRVSSGLEQGRYELVVVESPEPERMAEVERLWGANGLTAYDLLCCQTQEQDVIWIDDRCFSQYLHRDGNGAIIGILEILEVLRVHQDLSKSDYYEKLLQLRASNARYIPITSQEVIYHLKQATVKDYRLLETEELTILRRYVASCLLDSHRLQRPSMSQENLNPDGEQMFVLECFRATQDAISEVWADEELSEEIAAAYSDWMLLNLYTGIFGAYF